MVISWDFIVISWDVSGINGGSTWFNLIIWLVPSENPPLMPARSKFGDLQAMFDQTYRRTMHGEFSVTIGYSNTLRVQNLLVDSSFRTFHPPYILQGNPVFL
jgi:hypothetical protein